MSAPFRLERATAAPTTAAAGKGAAASAAPTAAGDEFKNYLDRLLKLIPAEVIGLYLVGSGFIPPDNDRVLLIWSILCLAGVVAVRAYGTSDTPAGMETQWGPVVISSVAFVIWIYTLGGVFAVYGVHEPYIGSLAVLAFTFFLPIVYKGPRPV